MNIPFSAESLIVFRQTLLIMLQGMTGIFIFMGVFYCLISVLNYIFKHKTIEE